MKVFTESQVSEILAYANDLAKMVEANKILQEHKEEATNIVAGVRSMVNLAEAVEVKVEKK